MSETDSSLRPLVTAAITALFAPGERETVTDMLIEECNAKRLYTSNDGLVERVQLAVLKISNGQVDKFLAAAELAQLDWRDALMAAGFGNDVEAHLKWASEFRK
jgi:hypothetical protein